MASLKRPLVLLGLCLFAAALALGAFLQFSTTRTLERAEAFQFRRMLVNQQQEKGVFRFFYVTNRAEEQADGELDNRFGNARESELRFGLFDTDIEQSLGLGMLVNPTDWFQNEEIRLLDVRSLEREEFLQALRRQVDASPQRSLLININGFRERFPSALRKTAFLAHVLDVNTPLLVFDWPGNQGSSPRGYRRAQETARDSGAELARTIRLILDDVRPDSLAILANSMGGEVLVSAFSILYRDADIADAEHEIIDVVLTAPDISHEQFGAQFAEELDALAREVTVYVSSNDRALLMSRIVNREQRLGESTLDTRNPEQSEEAAEAWELVQPGSEQVTLVDVTPVNRTRNFHNFSLETPEFFDDLFLRLTTEKTPPSRLRYRVRTPGGREYWVLTRGR